MEDEEKLTARSVRLIGRPDGAVAQVINYGAAAFSPPPALLPGQDFVGALGFHPGEPALRAAFRNGRARQSPAASLPGATDVAAALDGFAAVLALAPWTERWPLRLSGVRFGRLRGENDGFGVGDATGSLALRADHRLPALLTVSAGRAVELFGFYDGAGLVPTALMAEGHHYTLPSDAGTILARVA